ncbi:PASTA domain-containing protein [Kitasatospora sp. NPDC088783]|uniref:PASTA domain-containing protein n=1 Tax=Kitasatospora sp. NPDC088783 TaxID=3364077 RepID=UPI0037F5D722
MLNVRRTTTVGLLIAAAALTACDPTTSSTISGSTTPAAAPPPASQTAAPASSEPAPAAGSQAKTAELPDFTGMGLQAAQDKAQADGFYGLTSHDALGRSRAQIDDRNWKVCGQAPAAGQQPTNTVVDMAAVKLDEQCPVADQGAATPQAGASMPDVRGKSVATVRDLLPKNTSFSVKDATQGRMVLVESNWQVCSQAPAAGAALTGQPVTLTVVKFGETCP